MGGDAEFRELGGQVEAAMAQYHVPGVAVGVLHEGQEYTAGFGVTSVENPLPVDADTLFQIGSTTKTVTATAALRLVEQGRLDLDTPVRAYLPGLRLAAEDVAARVTLRHLFTHTGGWAGDYFDDTGPGEDALAGVVARMVHLPQLTPLGEVWSYNNAGFYIAGRVIEVVTGRPFETAIQELVLDPLGMSKSFFFPADVMTYRYVVGHDNPFDEGERPKVARPWALPRAAHPAGGVISTVKDQLRYARFHLGDGRAPDGTRLLTPESLAAMQTPRVPAANGEWIGITWFTKDVDGTRIVRHGGATNGQVSAFQLVPARQFAITVLTNAERGGALNQAVVKWAFEHYLGLVEAEPETRAATAKELAEYAGRYTAQATHIELAVRDGALWAQLIPQGGFPTPDSPPGPAPPPVRVALAGPDQIIALDEPFKNQRGEFLRQPDGRLAWLRLGGRLHAREP